MNLCFGIVIFKTCRAEALEISVTMSESTFPSGLYHLSLTKQLSTTKEMPSMVMDVSAMLVATTTYDKKGVRQHND